jgi:hypothetical protein
MRSSFPALLLSLLVAGVLGASASGMARAAGPAGIAPGPGNGHERAVLVELFTSEGCSSCPPADHVLMELDQAHRVAGAEVIVLGEHVDYWNRLGWVDPYSSARFSERQEGYAARFGLTSVYTPQMVVDGREELVGSDRARALRAISGAARQPKASVELALAPPGSGGAGGPVGLSVKVAGLPGSPDQDRPGVFLAVTERGLSSQVLRGENAGRRLEHPAVVRRLTLLGGPGPGQDTFSAAPVVAIDPGWKRGNLQAVVFVQEPRNGRILGAAALSL